MERDSGFANGEREEKILADKRHLIARPRTSGLIGGLIAVKAHRSGMSTKG